MSTLLVTFEVVFIVTGIEEAQVINHTLTIQQFWLPFDIYDTIFRQRPKNVDHNAPTGGQLRSLHAPYFKSMDDHVLKLNKQYGKKALYCRISF